jgi:hypothetical protein
MAGGQWRTATSGKYKNDLKIVYNGTAPEIPVQSPLVPLSKLS